VAHMHENQVERSVGSRDRVDGRTRPIAVLFLDNAVAARLWYDTIRYDTRCYFNVRSKADISQLNLPHGTDN